MVERVSIQSLILIALCLFVCAVNAETSLVSYNFDSDVMESGPDTYQVFRHINSKVEISERYAKGGYASAHLLDEPGDRDFVEFQGYFEEQKSGFLRCHFAFLITSVNSVFHVGLVGKDRYQLSPEGLNFWLTFDNAWLKHKSDSIPKKIFQPSAYVWYTVDATLDLNRGYYNLLISDESGKVQAQLDEQPFAAGAGLSYSLREFSFVGDLTGLSETDFYLDDFTIFSSRALPKMELKAPGRRKYFVDMWDEYQRQSTGRLKCIAAKSLQDFGIYSAEYERLVRNKKWDLLVKLIQSQGFEGGDLALQGEPDLIAIAFWGKACRALIENDFIEAKKYIKKSLSLKSTAYMYRLTELLVDSASKEGFYEVASKLDVLSREKNDMRNQIAMAMIAFHAGNYSAADLAIGDAAFSDLESFRKMSLEELRRLTAGDASWESKVEQYYFAALWQKNYSQAYLIAENMLQILTRINVLSYSWLERKGDAAFFQEDYRGALAAYEKAIKSGQDNDEVLLKIADIYHIQGDFNGEKVVREKIYKNFTYH
jgi:hypothetical protein